MLSKEIPFGHSTSQAPDDLNSLMVILKIDHLASNNFEKLIIDMQSLDNFIKEIEKYLESKQVPFTPGRGLILNWKKE